VAQGRRRRTHVVRPPERPVRHDESYLPAAELTLSTDVLDRIDEIVAPGTTINPDDNSYGAHELVPAARRR
jgi:hypothetical protein